MVEAAWAAAASSLSVLVSTRSCLASQESALIAEPALDSRPHLCRLR